MPDCLFCKIIRGEIPSHRVYEDERVLAFLDIHPVNLGHVLVVPKEHSETFLDMQKEDRDAVMGVVAKISKGIMKAVGSQACNLMGNVGSGSGQVIFHTHLHIIPRFEGDGRELWGAMKETPDLSALSEKIRETLFSL
jgi:histidine triad (HIT) family protein